MLWVLLMTLQPRLLADYAAAPTRRERAAVRRHWADASPSLFDDDHQPDDRPSECPVCGSYDHPATACMHGTALTFPIDQENQP